MRFYLLISVVSLTMACNSATNVNTNANISNKTNVNAANTAAKTSKNVPTYTYEIVNTFPHDPKAFTQGLIFRDGVLYESTGQEGESTLRKVELTTGKVLQKYDVPEEFFAEGMTFLNGKFYQLTWQDRTAFVYDADFKLLKEMRYAGDGWGLTHDNTNLIMSDGTHILRVVNPENFQTVRTLTVLRENGQPLLNLNELEYVKGEIWANIWHSEQSNILGKPNHIARIDPNSGKLLGWIDLSSISPEDVKRDSENTLNGIAYDEASERIFVTGKNWRKLFEIKVKPKQ